MSFSIRKDESGNKYGLLTVSSYAGTKRRLAMWHCSCECGSDTVVSGAALRSGNTSSCGCEAGRKGGEHLKKMLTTHGMTDTPTWRSWKSMHDRCLLESHKSYDRYSTVKICDRWLHSFDSFYADMGERPKGKTLDRIDNEGDYTPENCRWATSRQQARNRRGNRKISYNGKTLTIAEWSDVIGVKATTISKRISSGMPKPMVLMPGDLR